MSIPRRTVLRAGGASLLGLGGLSATSCSAAPAAGRFLLTVASWLGQGFGLKAGEIAAEKLPDAVNAAVSELPSDVGNKVGSAVYGFASNVVDRTNLRVAVAANFKRSETAQSEELRSYSIHLNSDGYVHAPSVVTLGLAMLAEKKQYQILQGLSAEQQQAQLPTIQAQLRNELSINVYELVNGSDLLNEFGVYRTVTFYNQNVEIEWDPTDSKTEQCRLTVRQGLIIKGRSANWDLEYDINIPSYQIWDIQDT